MRNEDKASFAKLLSEVMAGYGKPLPDGAMVNVWFNMLAPFEPATIRRAFDAYASERPDFVPVPNSISARCKLLDGRPDENEAWAVALTSRDERETVVWTQEMAEAFNVSRPLLETGDEIGARMAFKDAYARLVNEARAANKPARWSVSAGWDGERRNLIVQKAVVAGLLAGSQPHLAIAYEGDAETAQPEGLARVLEALATLEDPLAKADRIREERIASQERADMFIKGEIDDQVKAYLAAHPEARFGKLFNSENRNHEPE